jgi:hypothetical protein
MRIPAESERLALAMRHMPRASRENLRNSRIARERMDRARLTLPAGEAAPPVMRDASL